VPVPVTVAVTVELMVPPTLALAGVVVELAVGAAGRVCLRDGADLEDRRVEERARDDLLERPGVVGERPGVRAADVHRRRAAAAGHVVARLRDELLDVDLAVGGCLHRRRVGRRRRDAERTGRVERRRGARDVDGPVHRPAGTGREVGGGLRRRAEDRDVRVGRRPGPGAAHTERGGGAGVADPCTDGVPRRRRGERGAVGVEADDVPAQRRHGERGGGGRGRGKRDDSPCEHEARDSDHRGGACEQTCESRA